MITINLTKNKERITGSISGEQFGISYNETIYNKMVELEEALENAATPSEAKVIIEEFKALTVENADATSESDIPGMFKANNGNYYAKAGDLVTSIPVPEALVSRMRDSLDKGISTEPLFKFWFRFLRNKKFRDLYNGGYVDSALEFSDRVFNYVNLDYINDDLYTSLINDKGYTPEVAEELATTKQCKITKQGILTTFKCSKEITKKWILNEKGEKEQVDMYPVTKEIDPISGLITYGEVDKGFNENRFFEPAVMGKTGEEFFSGDKLGQIIKVGQVHKLKDGWNSINTDDHTSCVKGLHCGGLSYIKGYQTKDTETHNTLVDPAHIGAVPDDNTGAIRVIQYFTLDAFSGVNKAIYHSSEYAKLTDKQFEDFKAEVAKEYGEYKDKLAKDSELLSNI